MMSLYRSLARWIRSPRRPIRRPSPVRKALRDRRWRPALEELESRLAPAVTVSILNGVLTAQADSGPNTVTVDHAVVAGQGLAVINGQSFADASYNSIQVNGGAGGTTTFLSGNVKPVTVVSSGGTNMVNVGNNSSLAGILNTITINNGGAFAQVKIDDSADRTDHSNVVLSTFVFPGLITLTGLAPTPAAIVFGQNSLAGLTVLGGSGRNGYFIDTPSSTAAGGNPVLLDTGIGQDTVLIDATDRTAPLTINGGDAFNNDTVRVGDLLLNSIQGTVTILNGHGGSQVTIDNSGDNTDHPNVQLTATSLTGLEPPTAAIVFGPNALSQLSIFGGIGNNTYTVVNTPSSTLARGNRTTLNTGNGADTVNVQGTASTAPLTVNAGGTGTDGINVGNNGSLSGINGTLTLNNRPSFSRLNIDDSADAANHTNVGLTAYSLTGLAPADILFGSNSLDALTITGGNGNNTYTVNNTPFSAAPGGAPTVLNTGNGDDTIFVLGTDSTAPLTVNAAGRGNDVINLGNCGFGGDLSNINGTVTLNNATSWSHVNIDDGTGTADHANVRLTATSLTGLAPADILFGANSLDGLTITGGSGNNTYTVVNTPASRAPGGDPVALNTGNPNDSVTVVAEDPTAPLTVNGTRR
jgi:hypothetical protein